MSDLIERLELAEKRLRQYPPDAGFCTEVSFDVTEVRSILSALKTARGIEEITNTEGNSIEFVHKNADFNGLPNCCIVVTTDWSNEQTYRADTFAECVEAAGKNQ